MNCIICGGPMRLHKEDIPYRSLPGVVLKGVDVWRCTDCGEMEIVIPAITELHRMLALAISEQTGRLQPAHVKFLRKQLGWSGVDFARHFGVDPATVSRWENGKQPISLQAEKLLRVCATRLEPIDDYAALEALLDRAGDGPLAAELYMAHDSGGWHRAA